MEAGTIKPNKALKAMWAGMKDSRENRRLYEQMDNQCREVVNLWAALDPQVRDKAYIYLLWRKELAKKGAQA